MKISIITPSYNQAAFIGKTIESVLSEDYPDIEYIVMDGGSTDGTASILRSIDQRLKIKRKPGIRNEELGTFYWISKKDKGQVDAINRGIRMATGDIIGYINSDDYYEPGTIKKIVSLFEHHPDVMWVTGDCRIVDEKGREIQQCVKWYKKIFRYLPLSFVLPILNPITQPSTFWRREVMEEVGYFDERYHYAFDYDFWFRLIRMYPPYVISDILSSFRIHKESKGGKEYQQQFKEELEVAEAHTKNRVALWLHMMHNQFIVSIYSKIK